MERRVARPSSATQTNLPSWLINTALAGEDRDKVVSFECDNEHGSDEYNEIDKEVESYGMLDISVNGLAVEPDLLDRSRMDIRTDLALKCLEHDLESRDLDTAAG